MTWPALPRADAGLTRPAPDDTSRPGLHTSSRATAPGTPSGLARDDTPPLDPPGFERIRAFLLEEAGIALPPGRGDMIRTRLTKRLAATGLARVDDYLDLVHRSGGEERGRLISAFTTNVTCFFREAHHFDRLAEAATAAYAAGRPMRVWSAGCSSGQEPYSAALTLTHAGYSPADARVLAVDIDRAILRRGMDLRFTPREVDNLVLAARKRGLSLPPGPPVIPDRVRAMVEFRPLNLIGPWPMHTQFDAIFCRNVAIYFDQPTQARLWGRLIGMLKRGGLLFLGHAERLPDSFSDRVRACGQTTYIRHPAPEGTVR